MFENMEYIYEVYKQKSFSKAAQQLYISQSSLSLTIKKAETRIGAKIFDRSFTPIRLTEFGRQYIAAIEQIKILENTLSSSIGDTAEEVSGTLNIGAPLFPSTYILPKIFAAFQKEYPKVAINSFERTLYILENMLMDGQIDILISSTKMKKGPAKSWPLYHEHYVLAIPKTYMDKPYSSLYSGAEALNYYKDIPFILPRKGNDSRRRADTILKGYNLQPNIVLETDQNITACAMCKEGLGATIISDIIVRCMDAQEKVALFPLSGLEAERTINISVRHEELLSRAMDLFIKAARDYCSKL